MNQRERIIATLSYLWILALVPIVWRNKSEILSSHARSGITMLIFWIIILFVFQVPLVGVILGILMLIAGLVFTVWGIFDAVRGQEAKIPGVEKVAAFFK